MPAPARVVAHENVPLRFDRYTLTAGYNGTINARQFQLEELAFPTEFRYPDETYRDELTLEVGGERFELHHAKGETDDHTWTWIPSRRTLCCGDLFIWATPNAGNPQKAQRYPREWAAALRKMAELDAELMLPGHGLPVSGAERVRAALSDTAALLESLVEQTLELMNEGAPLDRILQAVRVPDDLHRPYLRAVYDEPEFIVRNLWRLYGGWYEGDPARLKPAADARLAQELAAMAGGAERLAERARELSDAGEARLAGHLAQFAFLAQPESQATRQCPLRGLRAPGRGGGLHDGPRRVCVDRCGDPPADAVVGGLVSAARIVAAVAAVALVCLAAYRVRSGRPGRAALGVLLAALLALYASDQTAALPDGDQAVTDAGDALGAWTYPFMAAMAFFETSIPPVTLVVPGEWAVMLGGAMAGDGQVEILVLLPLVWLFSAVGDSAVVRARSQARASVRAAPWRPIGDDRGAARAAGRLAGPPRIGRRLLRAADPAGPAARPFRGRGVALPLPPLPGVERARHTPLHPAVLWLGLPVLPVL